MTRKDFQLIADVIRVFRNNHGDELADELASDFAADLRMTNARFLKETFINATKNGK